MTYETILLKKENNIATITLNRPHRLNAMIFKMNPELDSAVQDIRNDPKVKVLVLTGAGRAFCAGGDFKGDPETPSSIAYDPKYRKPAVVVQLVRYYTRTFPLALQKLDIPTIAMVNGVAVGAGFSMVLACDMAIGSEKSRFCVAWTRRAHVPAFGDTWLLPRIVGLRKAAELIFTARFIEADEALHLGILNKLVPSEKLEEETYSLAQSLAKGPTVALRGSKINLYRGQEVDFETALELLSVTQAHTFFTEDWLEATRAFQEKREPQYKGE